MANNNPSWHNPEWAKTSQQTPIPCYASYDLKEGPQQDSILLFGGVHGDEPEGVALAEATLEWLTQQPPSSLCPWILIPCINPDGYAKGQRINANGVDLNRNYPSKNWSNEHRAERYFPGESPGSELETQAIIALIAEQAPALIIHCHSYEPCVVYSGEPAKPYADRLAESSGYPSQPTIGYDTPGSLSEYAWHDRRIPTICIEADHEDRVEVAWPRFGEGIRWIFQRDRQE